MDPGRSSEFLDLQREAVQDMLEQPKMVYGDCHAMEGKEDGLLL